MTNESVLLCFTQTGDDLVEEKVTDKFSSTDSRNKIQVQMFVVLSPL